MCAYLIDSNSRNISVISSLESNIRTLVLEGKDCKLKVYVHVQKEREGGGGGAGVQGGGSKITKF